MWKVISCLLLCFIYTVDAFFKEKCPGSYAFNAPNHGKNMKEKKATNSIMFLTNGGMILHFPRIFPLMYLS